MAVLKMWPSSNDTAGCKRATATHELLDDKSCIFCFFGFGIRHGKSPDVSPAESFGAIMLENVKLLDEDPKGIDRQLLVKTVTEVLGS